MNTLQLIFKNMRQRALSTWLTMLSVALGVGLAIAVILFYREGDKLFLQSDFGYNVLVGPKGDEMGLVFNSVYGLGTSKGSISWSAHEELMTTKQAAVRWAMPFMVGDTWQGKRVMATSSRLVTSKELETFRETLLGLGVELRTLGRPPATESADDRATRIAKVPAAIEAAMKQVARIDDATLAPLDIELTERFEALRASLQRAQGRIDPTNSAMTDAAGRIAADAVDQLRLLAGFAAPFEYRAGRTLELNEGRTFDARKFEGVIGAGAAEKLKLGLGGTFQLEHGAKSGDVHEEKWTVVGVLKPTGTAIDDTLFIPIYSGWAIPEHESGLESIARLTDLNAGLNVDLAPASKPAEADPDHADHHDEPQATTTPATGGAAPADAHDHDHADHDHAEHETPATTAPATAAAMPADAHDHDHDHADHDHAEHETPATTVPATAAAMPADAHDHDHADHGDDAPGKTEPAAPAAGGEMMAEEHDHDHAGHDHAHEGAYDMVDGRIHLHLEQSKWRVSGIFVGTRDVGRDTMLLRYQYMNTPMAMAVPVADTMREFFKNFLTGPTLVMLALAVLVTVVAAVSILVSIYNAVSARRREIAILRALGATKEKVLTLIVCEAAVVGLLGGLLGIVLGHVLVAFGSQYLQRSFGHGIDVMSVDWRELAYVAIVVSIAALAGLVPALQAYKTSVARNLVAE